MTFYPGHPKYGGRKPGGLNKKTRDRQREEARTLVKTIEALGIPPATLEELTPVGIMKFCMIERFRAGDHVGALAAATSVAPYVHPRLAITDMRVTNTYTERSTDELMAEREELAQKMAAAAAQQIEGTAVEVATTPAELSSSPPVLDQLDLLHQLDQQRQVEDRLRGRDDSDDD